MARALAPNLPSASFFEFVLQLSPTLLIIEIAGFGKYNALRAAEGERTFRNQQYVVRSFHDRARSQYRITGPEDARHRTRPMLDTVHHRGVHLLRPGGGEDAAPAGIEQRVVLERCNRLCHRIERIAAHHKNFTSGR